MTKGELHFTITGDPPDIVAALEKATETARRCCPPSTPPRSVVIRPRSAGVNLSVDVIVSGCVGNIPIPPNNTGSDRHDLFTIDGHRFTITVRPYRADIRAADIKYDGRERV